MREAEQALTELASRLSTQHACPVDTRLSRGSALDAITDLADELQSDLLVMGARFGNPPRAAAAPGEYGRRRGTEPLAQAAVCMECRFIPCRCRVMPHLLT